MARAGNRLPFEVGQEAESKCFTVGFRSAWFRCKIRQKGNIGYSLEFYDFPDEKVTWTKLYQRPPKYHGHNKPELMMRPSFPPFFHESTLPDLYPSSDIVVIVEDAWQVGDLVDWWSDGCFWSARVIQLLGNNRVQIELPGPPIGEGKSYEALCKDLRPSLQWSLEHGWTVPISREHGSSQYCARVVHRKTGFTHANKLGSSPYCARLLQPLKQDEEREGDNSMESITEINSIPIQLNLDGITAENYSCEASVPCDDTRDSSVEPSKGSSSAQRYGFSGSPDKVQRRKSTYSASIRHVDTVESAMMELEELANKIRWLKGLLQFGFRWSNAMKPSWTILEN